MQRNDKIALGVGSALTIGVAWLGRNQIRTGAKAVVEAAKKITGVGIRQAHLKLIYKHGIHKLVEQHRGSIPWGLAMAIIEHESGFDPTIYNYTGHGCSKKLCTGHWTGPGSRIGGGANGLFQIMSQFIKDYGVSSVDDLFNAETNIKAGLKMLNKQFKKYISGESISDPILLATLIYMGHAEGFGKVSTAISEAKKVGALTWNTITGLPWTNSGKGKWRIYNRMSGIAKTGAQAAIWEASKDKIMAGDLNGLNELNVFCSNFCDE